MLLLVIKVWEGNYKDLAYSTKILSLQVKSKTAINQIDIIPIAQLIIILSLSYYKNIDVKKV